MANWPIFEGYRLYVGEPARETPDNTKVYVLNEDLELVEGTRFTVRFESRLSFGVFVPPGLYRMDYPHGYLTSVEQDDEGDTPVSTFNYVYRKEG